MKKLLILSATLLLFACASATPPQPGNAVDRIKNYGSITLGKNPEDKVHGKQIGFWYGAIAGTEEFPANGVAFLKEFADKAFTGTVNLNILPRTDGKHFIVWLVSEDRKSAIQAGELTSIVGDARHATTFETNDDLSQNTTIIVTLETTTEPTQLGTIVAQGSLKETSIQ